jgi:hypothetical protein
MTGPVTGPMTGTVDYASADGLGVIRLLARFTRNEAVHGVFRSMCGSVFAVGWTSFRPGCS